MTGGLGRDPLPFPVFAPHVFSWSFPVALAAVVVLQVFLTLTRLSSLDDDLAARRRTLGRALLVLATLLAVTYFTTGYFTFVYQRYHPGREIPVPPLVTLVAVAVGLGFLAFEGSRRGPWSGIIPLLVACMLDQTLTSLRWTAQVDGSPREHLVDMVVVALGIGIVAVTVFLILSKRGVALPRTRLADINYLPLAIYALLTLVAGIYATIANEDRVGISEVLIASVGNAALVGASVAVARWTDADPRTLARAGLGALFHREELALVPFSFFILTARLLELRLFAAARSDDIFIAPATAEALEQSTVRELLPLAVGLIVLVALRPYLRWIERLPAAET